MWSFKLLSIEIRLPYKAVLYLKSNYHWQWKHILRLKPPDLKGRYISAGWVFIIFSQGARLQKSVLLFYVLLFSQKMGSNQFVYLVTFTANNLWYQSRLKMEKLSENSKKLPHIILKKFCKYISWSMVSFYKQLPLYLLQQCD